MGTKILLSLDTACTNDVIACLVPPAVPRPHNPSPGYVVLRAVQDKAQQGENQQRGETQNWWGTK